MPASQDMAAFREHYKSIIDILSQNANAVVAVPPVLIGEDLNNRWNLELLSLAAIIEESAALYNNVTYLDLRAVFESRLAQESPSSYLPTSATQILLDVLMLKTNAQVDKKAGERGLHVTLDGVHLNSAGADMVASEFIDAILSEGG
jgi:hypothetical protein